VITSRRRELSSDESGFTLVEVLVVVVIIGILASIAIAAFLKTRENAYAGQAKSDLRNLASAEEFYLGDHDQYISGGAAELAAEGFRQTVGIKLGVGVVANTGYCAAALAPDGSYYWWDSEAGGLQSVATPSLSPPATAGGACAAAPPTSLG